MSNICVANFRNGPKSANDVARYNIAPQQNVTATEVRSIINARSIRRRHLNPDIFSDPAWEILLELYASDLESHRHSIGSLCAVLSAPMTTVLRWLSSLHAEGMIERKGDVLDARRVYISLSGLGRDAMQGYFEEISSDRVSDPIVL